MAENLTLPVDAEELKINLVFTNGEAPYIRDFLSRHGREGETLQEFLIRWLIQSSIRTRHGILVSEENEPEETRRAAELSDVLIDLGRT